ncbi:ABC transporter substrate-binding protein [Aquabacterium humicola]|uniref:ABC transporter substrate-binding protein n=1 Tax=Aquabacterium humicola TaxID=3237377 RepID=UPI002543F1DB|nr:ABC transporter substrate-binding protein [Rubrivivax pictus]
MSRAPPAARSRLRLARVASLIGWLLCAIASGPAAAAADPLVMAVARLPLSLPLYVAEARGFLSAEDAPVRIVDCDYGRRCLERLLAGGADLATVAVLPLVDSALRGERFGVLATIATTRNDTKIVTRRGSGIDAAAALVGRRVGTFVGTSAQYLLDLSLLAAGVDPATVQVRALQPADAVGALRAREVDALAVFEPYAWQAMQALGSQAQVITDRRLHVEPWSIVVSARVLPGRDAQLRALCRALDRAMRFIAEQPDEAWAILGRRLGYDAAAVAAMRRDIDFALELRQSLLTSLEGQARWALRGGHARGTMPNFLDYLVPGPLEAVRPDAVTVVR